MARGSKPTCVGLDEPRNGRVSRPCGLQGPLADRRSRVRGGRLTCSGAMGHASRLPPRVIDVSAPAPDAEPLAAFEDSRRLMGANLFFDRPAVVLVPRGSAVGDPVAQRAWAGRVEALCAALGWLDPQPQLRAHAGGLQLAFAAPQDSLFTATEVNEWAWERSADALHSLSAEGITPSQPTLADAPDVAAVFAARAERERSRPLERLRQSAGQHGLPCLVDDDTLSIGAGHTSVSHARAALPLPMDVPWLRLGDVPTLLVTGSNGKTTTTRLLAAMASAAGHVAGYCSTEGVFVGGERVLAGDYAGPAGARAVLRHPRVEWAVLETARGGLLRRGLALQRADVAIVTNVSADHFGEYGIDSVEDIAAAKLVVAHALRGGSTLVLNADDGVLMGVAARTPHALAAPQALFAASHDHPALAALRRQGGRTCGARAGRLVLALGAVEHELGVVADLPLSFGGAARFNQGNMAAAALAAHAAGLPLAAIGQTLACFGTDPAHNAGRLERWSYRGATVLIDYAHNPDGLAQLLAVARALQPRRLGLLLGQAGNRDDAAIAALAATAARFAPDSVWIKELPLMLRGRALGEVPALLERSLLAAGVTAGQLHHEPDEAAGAEALLRWAGVGDVIVLPLHTAAVRARLGAFVAAQR